MNNATATYERSVPGLGTLSLKPLRIAEDIPLIHEWINRDAARYWGMGGTSVEALAEAYRQIIRPPHAAAWLGYHDGKPAFLAETYRPQEDLVAEHYDARPDDRGMHILVAPPQGEPISGFTWQVFRTLIEFIFSDPHATRIVVEPDVRNERIHRLNRRAGFAYQRVIDLPDKSAWLAFLTREAYAAACARSQTQAEAPAVALPTASTASADAVAHLDRQRWTQANRGLVRKMISEFAHERLIQPTRESADDASWGRYVLEADEPGVHYRFRARVLQLDHWLIDTESIERCGDEGPLPVEALAFLRDFGTSLEIDTAALPVYMEEILSTLYSSAYKQARADRGAAELARAEFQEIEAAMTEGHPCFVANSGRIGFDAADYRAYAPEAHAPITLVWLAAHRERATFTALDTLSHDELMRQELGEEQWAGFQNVLREQRLDPADYVFLPVHPWQWSNKLATVFADDIAHRRLVYLGQDQDVHVAQQSIRTFYNASDPRKHYVKTALSILNMGFMRGLSPYYMGTTPQINAWMHELITNDPWLREHGFSILREVATVGYRHAAYEQAIAGDSPYKKMLAALWRESPVTQQRPGQRLMTMAALLHRDGDGVALLPELIRQSPLDAEQWLRQYLRCYFSPLLHCFFEYDLIFMPHGENIILVLEDGVPVRAIMKDIAEEVAILNTERELPPAVRRLQVSVPEELKVLSIFTDVFDCFFRFLAEVLDTSGACSQDRFWALVAECVQAYQQAHPQHAEKFARHDLFAPAFRLSCLNRLQLANNQQMIDLADPAKNLRFAGSLTNPIAACCPAVAGAANG